MLDPGRALALSAALFLALPLARAPLHAQEEEQAAEQPSEPPAQEGGSGEENPPPVIENAPVEGQAMPDGADEVQPSGEGSSGEGEVIAVGEEPKDTGPDSGGLVDGDAPPPPPRRGRASRKAPKSQAQSKAKAQRKSPQAARSAAAAEALEESMSTSLVPAARLSLEPIKPIEPLPAIALSPIAPYNP